MKLIADDGQCIRSSDHCDGTQECTDSSDETGCSKLPSMIPNPKLHLFVYCLYYQEFMSVELSMCALAEVGQVFTHPKLYSYKAMSTRSHYVKV